MRLRVSALLLLPALAISASADTFGVSGTSDPNALITSILGSGVTIVGTPTYIGATNQSGTFTGGTASRVPFDSGIIITSGDATLAPSAYTVSNPGGALGTPGNAQLTALAGFATQDAAVLTFSFTSPDTQLFINYAFASSEYPVYVNSQYNDVFAFYLNGVNLATVPGTTLPVTINNVNAGTNPSYFAGYTSAGYPNFEYGGITTTLTASGALLSGVNTITIAIADTSDDILDSAVFIQGGTFSTQPPPNVPEPATFALMGGGLVAVFVSRKLFRRNIS